MPNQFGIPTTEEIFSYFEKECGYIVLDILEDDDGLNVMITVEVLEEVGQTYHTYLWEQATKKWTLEE